MANAWESAPVVSPGAAPAAAPAAPSWQSAPVVGEAPAAGARPATGEAPKPAGPQVSTGEAFVRGAREGITLSFNDEMDALTAAGVEGAPDWLKKVGSWNPLGGAGVAAPIGAARLAFGNESASKAYDDRLKTEREYSKAAEDQHPVANTAGMIGGSMLIPGAAAKTGMKGLMAAGALTGGLEGVGDGETAGERVTGGAIGAGIGAAAGPVLVGGAKVVGAAGRGVRDAVQSVTNPNAVAMRRVEGVIGADRARPGADVISRSDLDEASLSGQDLVVGDLGATGTGRLAGAARNTSEEAEAALRGATRGRYDDQKNRAGTFVEDLFGGNLNSTELNERLLERAKAENKKNYSAAERAAGNIDMWDDEFERLASAPAVQRAMKAVDERAANRAVGEGIEPIRNPFQVDKDGQIAWKVLDDGSTISPNIQYWNQVKINLDGEISTAQRAGDKQTVSELMGLKRALTSHVDGLVPEYATARAGASAFFGAEDALDAGMKFARQNSGLQFTDAKKAFDQMSPAEKELFQRGYASELVNTVRNATDGRDIVKMFDGANRRKLQAFLPEERLAPLEGFIRRERIMNHLKTVTDGGSRTAQYLADIGAGGVGTAIGTYASGDLGTGSMWGVLTLAAKNGRGLANKRVMEEVGKILSSGDPKLMEKFLSGPNAQRNLKIMRAVEQTADDVARSTGPGNALTAPDVPALTIRPSKADRFAEGGLVGAPRVQTPRTITVPGQMDWKAPERPQTNTTAWSQPGMDFISRLNQEIAQRMGVGGKAAGGIIKKAAKGALSALTEDGEEAAVKKGVLKRGDSKNMTQVPSLRGLSVDEATEIAKRDPHLIPSGDRSEGAFLGGPREINSKRGLTNLRKEFDEFVSADPRGGDWYDRYRAGMNEVTGGDPVQNKWMSAQEGQWSAGVSPEGELGFALKENNAAIAGAPVKSARPAQHEAHMRAVENKDVGEYQLGKKTGKYANLINPDQESVPGAVGVNDFRHARNFKYTEAGGDAQRDALTDAQHQFLDYETANAVRRANERGMGGRSNWTGEQLQAAPWVRQKAQDLMAQRGLTYDEAFEEANKTIADFFDKHTFAATHEAIPGANTGHLPSATTASEAERAAYSADPRSSWANAPGGRDAIYGGLGVPGTGNYMRVRPSREMQGFYTNEAGRLETNPGEVARPLVAFDAGVDGGPRSIAKADRDLLESGEHMRAYIDAQEAGAGHINFLKEKAGNSNSYFVPREGRASPEEMMAIREAGAPHGLGDVADTGRGLTLTNFMGTPKFDRDGRKGVEGALNATLGGRPFMRTMVDGVYEPVDWTRGIGSGAATRDMLAKVEKTPAMREAFDQNPYIPANARARMERDAEWSDKWGATREDIQNARRIIGEGPGWIDRLKKAMADGVILPAVGAAMLGAGALQREPRPGALSQVSARAG